MESGVPEDSTSDETLVARIVAGESALFETLMRRHNARLFRSARAILRDEGEAEDVMQQAYVNAYQHLGQFGGRARFATWLTRIAVHEALRRLRKRRRLTEIDAMSDLDDVLEPQERRGTPNPEEQAFAGELRVLLESAIDRLPARYRVVFVLREIDGLDAAEAAECLGLTAEAVRTRLHRARAALRADLMDRAGLATSAVFPLHLSRCDRVVAGVWAQLASPPVVGIH